MLSLTDIKNSLFGGAQATTSGTTRRARRQNRAAAAPPAAPVRNSNGSGAAIQADQLALTTQAQETNPYEGTAPGHARVTVGKWGSGQNDSLAGILHSQGYSSQEVYKKDANGRTLLDEVSRVNGLRNPNLIREGQELVIPSRAQENAAPAPQPNPEPAPTPQPNPQPNPEPAPAPQPNPQPAPGPNGPERPEPAVNQVRVDGWRQGDNDSLGAILKNQGFSDTEIYRRDANGDSLLNKVARANGLSSPDRIRAGQTLDVPNSMEALNQMNIPEMERPAPAPQPNPEPAPAPQPNPQPNPEPAPAPQPNPEPAPGPQPNPEPAPGPQPNPGPNNNENRGEATADMGMLLEGIREGKFKRDEFQYLSSLGNRYEETRAQFSADGFSDDELRTLGAFERRYGTDFARLYNRDDIRLSNGTNANSTDPKTQVRVRHYNESGQLWDNFSNGSVNHEAAITAMMRQRAEARELGGQ